MRSPKQLWAVVAAVGVGAGVVCTPAASITGLVKYEGEAPAMKPVAMDADPVCAGKHAEPVLAETLVLGPGQTMANVIVKIKSGLPAKTYPVPTEPAILDQEGCMYIPHVLVVHPGQEVKVLNSDGTLHNIHARPKVNAEFNAAMPKFRKEMTKTFDKVEEEPFPVKCDVHPWMSAWIAVIPHPHVAVTGADGAFSLAGLDAGTYEVEAWHERLGTQIASVTVGADEAATVNFTFSRP